MNRRKWKQEQNVYPLKGSGQMVTSYVSSWRHKGSHPKHAAILAARQPKKVTPEQQMLFERLGEVKGSGI